MATQQPPPGTGGTTPPKLKWEHTGALRADINGLKDQYIGSYYRAAPRLWIAEPFFPAKRLEAKSRREAIGLLEAVAAERATKGA